MTRIPAGGGIGGTGTTKAAVLNAVTAIVVGFSLAAAAMYWLTTDERVSPLIENVEAL